MKCFRYAILISFLFLLPSHAQYSSLRVGIMPFNEGGAGNKPGPNSKAVASELSSSLYGYRFIKLIEQSESEAIEKEIVKGMAGIYDMNTVIDAGKRHGIQIMIHGSIDGTNISGRAIDVETGAVIASRTVPRSDINLLGRTLAAGIETHLARLNLKRLRNDSPDINLEFWMEKIGKSGKTNILPGQGGSTLIGDRVVFHFKSNRDGFVTIIDIQPGGDVVVLFPNDIYPSNKVLAGKEYKIPGENDGFEITVSEPAGTDTIIAFFTRSRVEWLDRNKLKGEGFKTVKRDERIGVSRGLNVTATKINRSHWESKTLSIEVEK